MTRAQYDAEQARIPGTWQNAQGRGDDGTEEYGMPGTGVVLAVIATLVCIGAGLVAFEVVQLLKRCLP